jgi:hypothetical protein
MCRKQATIIGMILFSLLILLMASCASLGPLSPESFHEGMREAQLLFEGQDYDGAYAAWKRLSSRALDAGYTDLARIAAERSFDYALGAAERYKKWILDGQIRDPEGFGSLEDSSYRFYRADLDSARGTLLAAYGDEPLAPGLLSRELLYLRYAEGEAAFVERGRTEAALALERGEASLAAWIHQYSGSWDAALPLWEALLEGSGDSLAAAVLFWRAIERDDFAATRSLLSRLSWNQRLAGGTSLEVGERGPERSVASGRAWFAGWRPSFVAPWREAASVLDGPLPVLDIDRFFGPAARDSTVSAKAA